MSTAFSHLDPGTEEAHWRDEIGRRSIQNLDTDVDLLVVVAAHPDDETLGAAGLMAKAESRGTRVVVVVATGGEHSHPASPTHTPEQLASLRRTETTQAVSVVAPGGSIRFLGLPDGGLDTRVEDLRAALAAALDEAGSADPARTLVAAPWSKDRHRDHRIVAEACGELCDARGIRHVGYPVWAWHWGTAADLPWPTARAVRLDSHEVERKARAIALHTTQIEPLSPQQGDEVLLHEGMRSHFERDVEVFFIEGDEASGGGSLDAAWFDAFYDRNGDDPWGFESRWYEKRKRDILLASLPERRLGRVLEVGCSTGVLTAALAERSDAVVAMDAAEAAVMRARERLASNPRVSVRRAVAPDDWPEGEFDTIVVSEVAYYLSAHDLARLLARIAGSLGEDGCVVACHWRHPVAAYPLTGDDVHRTMRELPGLRTLATHLEDDFVLDVFAPQSARSVAQREGLA